MIFYDAEPYIKFNKWWEEHYKNAFDAMPAIMESAFKEIAQNAWLAALESE